jgi:hypothetical protein
MVPHPGGDAYRGERAPGHDGSFGANLVPVAR